MPNSNSEQPAFPDDDDYDEIEFIPCDRCDGHPACEDFGCAYAAGLGRLVEKNRKLTGGDL